MNNIKIKVDGFLKRYKMHYDNININKSCKDFVGEMERGLRNEDSTLDYYVMEVLDKKLGIYCEFLKAENSILVGTAITGILN
jgi:hypothetical protein